MALASNERGLTMPYTFTADPRPIERADAERAPAIRSVRRVGVVGLGVMGLGIAQAAAAAGLQVVLVGRDVESAIAGRRRLTAQIQRQVSRNRLSSETAAALLENVAPSKGDVALGECDLAIEAVDEDRGIKAQVLRRIEGVLPEAAPIATNTSGLTISGLAGVLSRPQRFIGLHFFSPAERMPLVEVIPGVLTDPSTERDALAFVANIGKRAVVVRDSPGFFTSRVFAAYLDEALAMVGEGVSPALIEQAAQASGRAVGPLAVLDEVSLQLNLQQGVQARADGLEERFCRPLAMPVLSLMTKLGRGGRRHGGGFYDWSPDGARQLWGGHQQVFRPVENQPALTTLELRLLCAEALEALRCLEENVIASADDADAASLLGLGFPASTGGILHRVEDFGFGAFAEACDGLAHNHGARFAPSAWLQHLAGGRATLAAWRSQPQTGSAA
jgi:3-hydroxyacyl-CoA dehydrogenase/enoyl-CoA hydratase/3-hydroxybutyryl-CoA epimerase